MVCQSSLGILIRLKPYYLASTFYLAIIDLLLSFFAMLVFFVMNLFNFMSCNLSPMPVAYRCRLWPNNLYDDYFFLNLVF